MLITVTNNSPNISSNRARMNRTIPYALWSNGGTSCTQLNGCTKTIVTAPGPTINLSDLLTAVVYLPLAYYCFAALLTSPPVHEWQVSKWFRGVRTDGNVMNDKNPKWKPSKLYLGTRALERAHWPTAMVFAVCEILILIPVMYFLGIRRFVPSEHTREDTDVPFTARRPSSSSPRASSRNTPAPSSFPCSSTPTAWDTTTLPRSRPSCSLS